MGYMLSFFSEKWKQLLNWADGYQERLFPLCKKKRAVGPVCKILCVDDDNSFCLFMQQLASSVEVHLDAVDSIKEAKKIIEENPPYQAFIIDGHLPDGSGFELVAWIREKKKLTNPIGFISRFYLDATSFRILKENLKVDYILEKPISPSEVHQLLNQLCQFKTQSSAHELFSDELIANLKASYQKKIPDKIERLEKMILAIQNDPNIDHLQALRGEVHKIAGSAGSYGYEAVSDLCERLELDIIKQIDLAKRGLLNPQWLISLDNFFTKIKLEFQFEFPESEWIRKRHLPSVFIVEEDQTFLNILTQQREDPHFNILTELHPDQAIQTLFSADFYPQILLLNAHYQTSALTAYELIKAFYRKNDYLTTVIALMVEDQALNHQVEALQRGMTFILTKLPSTPLLLPLLDQTLFRALPLHFKILVIDDDSDIREYISKTLKYTGLEVTAIHDIHDLEKNFTHLNPDLILVDIELVDESGIGIFEKLRKVLGYKKILVGLLPVNQHNNYLIQRCYDADVDDILFKIFEGGILQKKIAYLLRKQTYEALAAVKDPLTGLENLQTLKLYLNELQRQFKVPIPKILVIFEVENFTSIDQKINRKILKTITQSLEDLLQKFDMAAYLGDGRFALVFQGFDPNFVQLFIHTFLLNVHFSLTKTFLKDLHINECLLILSPEESADDILQRNERLLHDDSQQPMQPVRMVAEKSFTALKEVIIVQDEPINFGLIKAVFEAHAFKVTLTSSIDEEIYHSMVPFPLLILKGSLAKAKSLVFLKKLSSQNQQIPVVYLSDLCDEEYLQNLLNRVNYFEDPFGMVIFMAEQIETE
jgi:DNA-binding response OmpR family regulator